MATQKISDNLVLPKDIGNWFERVAFTPFNEEGGAHAEQRKPHGSQGHQRPISARPTGCGSQPARSTRTSRSSSRPVRGAALRTADVLGWHNIAGRSFSLRRRHRRRTACGLRAAARQPGDQRPDLPDQDWPASAAGPPRTRAGHRSVTRVEAFGYAGPIIYSACSKAKGRPPRATQPGQELRRHVGLQARRQDVRGSQLSLYA